MTLMTEELEHKCRQIAGSIKRRPPEATPEAFVMRELALLLDHVDTIRDRQKAMRRRLREKELFFDTQTMNIDKRIDLLPSWLERTKLKNEFARMFERVQTRIHRILIEDDAAILRLQVRLLELLNMYEQLSIEYGDPQPST